MVSHERESTDAVTRRYEATADGYAAYWAPVLREPSLKLVEHIEAASAGRVLDIGAGTGAVHAALVARFPDAQIVGVDSAVGMLSKSGGKVPVAAMDALFLAFPDNLFDVAVMCFVLFHLPDPVAGLVEARRVLKPGAAFCTSTWASSAHCAAEEAWNRLLEESGAKELPPQSRHDLMDTPEKVAGLLTSAGFVYARVTQHEFTFQTGPEDLLKLKTHVGESSQRVHALDDDARLRLINNAREEFAGMAGKDFLYRMQIILSYAQAP